MQGALARREENARREAEELSRSQQNYVPTTHGPQDVELERKMLEWDAKERAAKREYEQQEQLRRQQDEQRRLQQPGFW
jgi:hypothetical protein